MFFGWVPASTRSARDADAIVSKVIQKSGRPAGRTGNVPFSGQLRQVLGYLSSHLHQRDIAATMYVSLNTVKTHVKAIYRKFGAASRTEAVAIARSRGLL